jgi:long-chain acyl-CoA synthetase
MTLDVSATLANRRILVVGATGFVGKVALSLLLHRYPHIARAFVLVRPGAGSTSEERFFGKVITSPAFAPVREAHGDAFFRDKCVPLAGDVARPDLNFTPEDLARLGHIDVIINCAGLVSFTPSLETALRINTLGVRSVVGVAKATGAGVVHVSTCFVVGNRDGEFWEDEPVVGYNPRGETGFDVDGEIGDCERIIAQVKALADDRAHASMFRARASVRLTQEGRDPDEEKTLRLAVARERKRWVSERLTELGMERAQHWGWPNIYTYTKSLGDQVLAGSGVPHALVRPSIVESSVRYPVSGWNEGFTTSAPLAYLALKGHRTFAAHKNAILDVVPVDLLASVLVAAAAAVVAGSAHSVYHASTGDSAPLPTTRAVELTGLYARQQWRERETGSRFANWLRSRLETVPRSKRWYNSVSAPAVKGIAQTAARLIDTATPRWGAPRVRELADDLKGKLAEVERVAGRVDDAFQLFMPFIHDNHIVFRSDHTRALFGSLAPADRERLPWDPEAIEWRDYWLRVHMPGLKKWVFPDLEEEFQPKLRPTYTYKDLLELFDATTKLHRSRVAFRLLGPPDGDAPVRRFTFRQVAQRVQRAAGALAERGVTAGERILLVAENRPEWGIAYFAVLKAGATVVPVDANASLDEIANIARAAEARVVIASERVRARLPGLVAVDLDDLGAGAVRAPTPVAPRGDDIASLIFTSGTTGEPKGVMLSHKNFTSLLSKLAAVFDLKPHDKLLSVLPLHHTFEFTAGFLLPFMRGAQITYLDEVTPDAMAAALEGGEVSAMIGVPAVWQALHRQIEKAAATRGPWVEELFDALVDAARRVRDATGVNVGRALFWRVHRKLGGRLRLLVSGGSALPPDVWEAFHGLGFSLYEGYGLTEAAPVLTVNRPGTRQIAGSVGEPLPGIELKIGEPDANGVGEVLASGPNVMVGYYRDGEATADAVRDGWLHTGDLGRLDDERRLTIVGRKKEMILGPSGENVYPDELEPLYADSPWVKELSIVGLPDGPHESVACLLVPDYARGPRDEVRTRVLEHVRQVSQKLPLAKRVKVLHLWDRELPRTGTRKVKRTLVIGEIQKLERVAATAHAGGGDGWLYELAARVSGRPRDRIGAAMRLDELGFDSLMLAELAVALDEAGAAIGEEDLAGGGVTLAELARLAAARRRKDKTRPRAAAAPDELPVPAALVGVGRRLLRWGQRMTYERLFDVKVTGRAYLPASPPFIVAANHTSHLDMGLVKHALGDLGPLLVALAAKDYFFEDRLRRAYFENFTNLLPIDRHGPLRESLRLAANVLHEGRILLLFPEGTRSEDGQLQPFKPSIGYLALTNDVDVVPMYLAGTHDALPKGRALPAHRNIAAHIGPTLTVARLRQAAAGLGKSEANREATRVVEEAVRTLRDRA